jgi:hypothetical protein
MDWINKSLALNKKLLVIERTVKALLLAVDQDHGQDMRVLIKTEARNIYLEQLDITNSSFQRSAPTETTDQAQAKAAAAKAKKAAAAAAKPGAPATGRNNIAFTEPNSVSCWYETNGLFCPNKNKVNGVCKYADLHGTCGMPLSNGNYCLEKHSALDHK